jgi:hypothetical protein
MDRYKPVSAEEMQEAQLASEAYLKSIMRLEGQIYGTEKQNTDLLKEKQNTDLVEENKKTKIENSTIENDTAKSITGGGPKIINISIGKFLDAINITTNNLRDSENEIEARILDMFGRIVVQGGYAQ